MLAISTHVFHNIQEAIVHVRMVRKLDLYLVQIRQRIAHIECRLDFPGQYDVSPFLFFFFLYACIHTMAVAAASVYLIQASHAGSGASRERLTAQVQTNRRSRVRSSGVRV